jgi:hypothetical protein
MADRQIRLRWCGRSRDLGKKLERVGTQSSRDQDDLKYVDAAQPAFNL